MDSGSREGVLAPELYFLISKFLAISPLEETKKALVDELQRHKILPKRMDWLGQEHDQSFEELERKYPHVGPRHLLEICSRIGPILDRELPPSVPNLQSLLGAGRQSLLRTKETIHTYRSLIDYCTRLNNAPLAESIIRKNNNNLTRVIFGREHGGPIIRRQAVSSNFYEKLGLLRRTLGHLSAVYCVLFDRSGKYILTGADDLLVKLWSAIDGRLLATFRGASLEITDIAVNLDNTLLAAGSLDRILRVWDLQTTAPVAVLTGHTGTITSVNFCPSPRGDMRYLVSTSSDGSVAFWQYAVQRGKTTFSAKPTQYHEKIRPGQAQMICAAFSPGGIFLAAGSADHYVRVYLMSVEGPKRILETEAHTDTVDSIQWAHQGLRFISGSKDGTAHIWIFDSQQWRSMKLNMSDRLPSCPQPDDDSKKIKVTMVSWDSSDRWVMTAVNDFTIKVWDSKTGKLHKVLRGHTDELYVLESHPKDPHVLLSAGHDGQIFLWDIFSGTTITSFVNHIESQGHGGVFDAKWSPDGTMIAGTDSHGHILMYGFGQGHDRLKKLPTELFFHTDYRPLIRDSNHHVLDEQTQTMPHLMPPPFLVDVDGNPHPPMMQRLVPGRENCPTDQLIPNIGVGNEGMLEIQPENTVSEIDRLIEALAQRHGQDAPDSNNDRENPSPAVNNNPNGNRVGSMNSPRAASASGNRIALRRSGDVEGVRQSSGNWHRDASFKFHSRCFVKPIRYSRLQQLKHIVFAAGHQEMEIYRREMRRRPVMISTAQSLVHPSSQSARARARGNTRRGAPQVSNPAYRTRSIRVLETISSDDEEDEQPEESNSSNSSDSSANEEEMALDASSDSDTESSEYSDWVADQPGPNLEPPQRSKRKPVARRAYSPTNSEPATSAAGNGSGPSGNGRRRKMVVPRSGEEIPEAYRPPEWLMEVIPRKAPYYPQMGDEVVYLRQGHQRYLEAVRAKKVYKLNNNCEPWVRLEMRAHEVAKVIGIKYEIRPPRLCCLKLALLDSNDQLTGNTFTIKYHDMPDVLDFLVLKQTFDTAMSRNWQSGDRFRCMIDDGWWMGQIETRTALSNDLPQSVFMCFHVRWDNGEYEYMSPWDMEPIDEQRLPSNVGGAVPVLPEELRATLYQPSSEEWLRGDRESACRRIIAGLEQVMGLAIADPFLAPVDLNIYPAYAFAIEYPIDLSTIKARFENHFYRRITSAQFDVRYLATNAEKFNESHSNIVRHARIITDLCLRVIRDYNEIDVGAVYHQLVDTYISSDSDDDTYPRPSSSRAPTNANASASRAAGSRRSQRLGGPFDWRRECRELLEMIWQCDDSTPFREPVDVIEHPDYNQIVDTPMDLLTIKEDLFGGNYQSPTEFIKDMRLIFQNSKNYNTNKRSRIYSMTLRLSSLFEIHVRPIINNWKMSKRSKNRHNRLNSSSEVDPNQPGTSKMVTRAATNGSGGSGAAGSSQTRRFISSDDDDDDDDDYYRNNRIGASGAAASSSAAATTATASTSTDTTTTRNGRRIGGGGGGTSGLYGSSTNGVSSSSMIDHSQPGPSYRHDPPERGGPSSSGARSMRNRPSQSRIGRTTNGNDASDSRMSTRPQRKRTRVVNDEESGAGNGHSSDSSSDSSDSDGSNGIPLAELGVSRRPARGYDSEESYKPGGSNGGAGTSRRKAKKKKKKSQKSPKRKSSRRMQDDSEDDDERVNNKDDDDEEVEEEEMIDEEMDNVDGEEEEEDDDEEAATGSRNRASKRVRNGSRRETVLASSSRRDNLRQRRPPPGRRRDSSEDDDEFGLGGNGSSEDEFNARRRKKGRYETDQNYEVRSTRPQRRTNRALSSGTDDEVTRPTRTSNRRRPMSHDDDDDDEHARMNGANGGREGGSQLIGNSQRRSNRQKTRIHDSDEDDNDHEDQLVHRRGSSRLTSHQQQQATNGRYPSRRHTMNGGRVRNDDEDEEEDDDDDGVVDEHHNDDEEEMEDEEVEQEDDDTEDDDAENSDDQPLRRRNPSRNSNILKNSRNSLRTRSGRRVHSKR